METNRKTTGDLLKTKKLIKILKKCNGKAVIGNSEALISPKVAKIFAYCGLVILFIGLFVGSYMVQPYLSQFVGVEKIAQVLMMGMLVLSFILAVKNIITVLYTTDDIELLLPMPFSATQIVMAKLAVASVFPVALSVIMLNSICIGLGVHAGVGVSYIIGIIISSFLMPITGISIATLLVVVIFRIFGVMRNRDVTVALGGIFTFGLSVAYIFVSNGLEKNGSEAFNMVSYISSAVPTISYMNKFMVEGNIVGLLISLAISLVFIVLATLAVKTLYFKTALSMQNTSTKKKNVTKALQKNEKKKNALKSLTSYESKSTKRNPAYLVYGFVMSFVWPLIFALPFILGNNFLNNFNNSFGDIAVLIAFMSFALAASCTACGYSILAGTAFSREGNNFSFIKALPIDYNDYYKSKRNFALRICSLGSVLYVVILGIIALATGVVAVKNIWIILVSACFSFFLNIIYINLLLLKNSRKPNFDWDSETEISRKLGVINAILIVLGIVSLMIFMADILLGANLNGLDLMPTASIICFVVIMIAFVLAIAINKFAMKKSIKNLMTIE